MIEHNYTCLHGPFLGCFWSDYLFSNSPKHLVFPHFEFKKQFEEDNIFLEEIPVVFSSRGEFEMFELPNTGVHIQDYGL